MPPRRPPSFTSTSEKERGEREAVSAQSKGLGKQAAVQQEAQQPEEHEEVIGSGGGGDSGGGGSLDSAFSLMEGDFSMSMERFSEQRKIKQLQLDGADFMHYIKVGLAHCLCRVGLWKTMLFAAWGCGRLCFLPRGAVEDYAFCRVGLWKTMLFAAWGCGRLCSTCVQNIRLYI